LAIQETNLCEDKKQIGNVLSYWSGELQKARKWRLGVGWYHELGSW